MGSILSSAHTIDFTSNGNLSFEDFRIPENDICGYNIDTHKGMLSVDLFVREGEPNKPNFIETIKYLQGGVSVITINIHTQRGAFVVSERVGFYGIKMHGDRNHDNSLKFTVSYKVLGDGNINFIEIADE